MILCMDVGNSQFFAGVLDQEKILLRFRYNTKENSSSDQIGIFLRSVLRENAIELSAITDIAICSVVPSLEYSLRAACVKYFNITPLFLQAGIKTGLKIRYHNPLEVGADRIANAIAGRHFYPEKNLIIFDFGTATTLCAISKTGDYLGGVIMAGIKLSMQALQSNTAKLIPVEIIKPKHIVGRSTRESIQSGLYYGQAGMIRELTERVIQEHFSTEKPVVIGTGGFVSLFEKENLFDAIQPDLVLQGLSLMLKFNR